MIFLMYGGSFFSVSLSDVCRLPLQIFGMVFAMILYCQIGRKDAATTAWTVQQPISSAQMTHVTCSVYPQRFCNLTCAFIVNWLNLFLAWRHRRNKWNKKMSQNIRMFL